MTRIDFYVLDAVGEPPLATLACRIAGKARQLGHRVHIHSGDAALAELVDQRLWTWSQQSFVPHILASAIAADKDIERNPVIIGVDAPPPAPADLLINLAIDVPDFFSRFERVAELVNADQTRRDAGRKRYRYYRDRGYELANHAIAH